MVIRRFIRSLSFEKPLLAPGIILLLALVYLWPLVLYPNGIPMTAKQQVTDFLVAHLPYARYIHEMWFTYGHPPLWNSSMLSGMPLVADPLAGYFYLPNWLLFIFPQPWAFNLLLVLHLAWMGLGMFFFLRSNALRPLAALFGAAVWMGTPRLVGYIGSGQISSVFALAWFPWLLLVIDRLARSLSLRKALLAAGVLSTIILIDIRWGFLAGILSLAFLFARLPYRKISFRKAAAVLALFLMAIVLLTAVLSIPLRELMLQSDRTGLTTSERAAFSLGIDNLLGMLAPQFGILYELITYVGLVVMILGVLGLRGQHWFWGALIIFAALFSIGENGPLFPLISNLVPGFSWLRVPSRLWFFVALGFAVLSAYGFDRITNDPGISRSIPLFRKISIAIGLFAVLLAAGVAMLFPPLPQGILLFALVTPLTLLLLNLIMNHPGQKWPFLLILLAMVDLLWVNSSYLRSVPLDPAPPAVRWLEAQPGLFRVFSPSYSLPQPNRLQTAEGVNPNHLSRYSQFLSLSSGIRVDGYSVSVPGVYLDQYSDPRLYASAASPDLYRLGLLNVKYIVSSFPMNMPDALVQSSDGAYIYQNPQYRERAWTDGTGSVQITDWSPDHIVAEASAKDRALVTFSEIDYPGWKAAVDHQEVTIERVDGLLRGVYVPAGKHIIELSYVPFSFYSGLVLSLFAWGIFFLIGGVYVASLVARSRRSLS